jgi:hypothetical protein
MIQKIKNHLLIAVSALMLLAPVAVPAMASAACTSTANNIATGANKALGDSPVNCSSAGNGLAGLGAVAKNIVDIFSILVGIVAVIMIIYGGFRYITSGGDSGSVGNAKNTLIYAIVGLIIVALAQVIVRFVLSTTSTAAG